MPKKTTPTKPAKPIRADLLKQISDLIDERVRPFVQMDGGDLELVELTQENILRVRMHGACNGCMASTATLQYGVQQALDEAFPEEDIEIQLVENEIVAAPHMPPTHIY